MKFRLRSLLFVLAIAPPFIAWMVWQYNLSATDFVAKLAQLILFMSPLLVIGFFELRRSLGWKVMTEDQTARSVVDRSAIDGRTQPPNELPGRAPRSSDRSRISA